MTQSCENMTQPSDADQTYMRRALDLAARARGRTSPNPMVGAVLVGPFAWPYWQVQQREGFARNLYEASQHEATPASYLRVPPGHEKHWSKHCAQYHACGRPVYFVREDWYQKEYVPRQYHRDHESHDNGHDDDRQDGNSQGHGHGHEGRGN